MDAPLDLGEGEMKGGGVVARMGCESPRLLLSLASVVEFVMDTEACRGGVKMLVNKAGPL